MILGRFSLWKLGQCSTRSMSGSNCPRGTETSGTSLRKPKNSKRQNSFCGEAGRWGIVEVTGRCCDAHSRSRIYVALSSHLETPGESCLSWLEVRTLCWFSGAIRFEPCSSPDYCHICSECWENCQIRFTIHIFCKLHGYTVHQQYWTLFYYLHTVHGTHALQVTICSHSTDDALHIFYADTVNQTCNF